MKIKVSFTADQLPSSLASHFEDQGETGAFVEFSGIVRDEEAGARITGLRYELYEAMALREMQRLIAELGTIYPCHRIEVIHRYGLIPVGEAAILVAIAAKHRREAFALLSELMDRLKTEVPIWKVEVIPC